MTPDQFAQLTLLAYFGAILALVLWRALRHPQGWRLWLLYLIDALYCRLCFHWRANRPCPFLDEPSAIIIANHRSPVDPVLIWAGVTNGRPLECMAAREYFGIRGLQFIMENLRAIPVARDGKDMGATRTALRRLQEGRLLGVFPEGGINTDPSGGLRQGNTGVAWLALHSKVPVYPVFIHNAPKGKNMVDPFWHFTRVRVSYGDAIDLSEYRGRKTTPALLQEATDLLMARLAELGGVRYAGTAPPEDSGLRIMRA
jgi:1-acyl-sn-glycerol-3-phosphate acyltransferase